MIWAHEFQDAGTPIGIPLNQLRFDGVCTYDILKSMGFAFATNSYSVTGPAVVEGIEDIVDLANIFTKLYEAQERVYVVGHILGIFVIIFKKWILATQYGVRKCPLVQIFIYSRPFR